MAGLAILRKTISLSPCRVPLKHAVKSGCHDHVKVEIDAFILSSRKDDSIL
jgi:hypothetical protein